MIGQRARTTEREEKKTKTFIENARATRLNGMPQTMELHGRTISLCIINLLPIFYTESH